MRAKLRQNHVPDTFRLARFLSRERFAPVGKIDQLPLFNRQYLRFSLT